MPRVNLGSANKHDRLLMFIKGAADVNGKTHDDLGRMMGGVTAKTVRSRLKSPGSFTLDELEKIGRGLNIPIDDLRACIRY
jgi:hypothetical protein